MGISPRGQGTAKADLVKLLGDGADDRVKIYINESGGIAWHPGNPPGGGQPHWKTVISVMGGPCQTGKAGKS